MVLSRQRPDDESAFGPDVLRVLAGRSWIVTAIESLRRHPDLQDAAFVVAAPVGVYDEVGDVVVRTLGPGADPLLVPSGPTVHASLHAALDATASWNPLIRCVIHDVSRPLVTDALVETVLAVARDDPDARVVPTLPLVETVKAVGADGRILRTLDRGGLVRVQTPQAASLGSLREVHRRCAEPFGSRPNLVGDALTTTVVAGEDRADVMASGHDGDMFAAAWRT